MQDSWSEWATVIAALLTALAAIGAGYIVPRSNAQRAAETFRAVREAESVSGDMTPASWTARFVVSYQAARDCATALEPHRFTWALGAMGLVYVGMGLGLVAQAASLGQPSVMGLVVILIGIAGFICAFVVGARVSAARRRIVERIMPDPVGVDPNLAARLRSRRRMVRRRDVADEGKLARLSMEMRHRRIAHFEAQMRGNPDQPTPKSLGTPGSANPRNGS